MKISEDYVYVFKSADGNITGIVQGRFEKMTFYYDIVYDANHNNLIESIDFC